MPSKSEKQKKLMCIAHSIKQGKQSPSYSKQATKIAESMSGEKLKEFCEAPVEED